MFFHSCLVFYYMVLWFDLYPPKKICWSPNPHYLRTWPYLEISEVKMRSYWSTETPNSVTGILIRKWPCEDRDRKNITGRWKLRLEWSQGRPRIAGHRQKLGKELVPQRRNQQCGHLDFRLPPKLWEIHFYCSKPSSLWYLVTKTLGN